MSKVYPGLAVLCTIVGFVLFLAGCAFLSHGRADTFRSVPDQHVSAFVVFKRGWIGGSAVVLSEHTLLTAYHVVEGLDTVVVTEGPGAKEIRAKVIKTDPVHDLALLRVTEKLPYKPTTVAPMPSLGNIICLVAKVPQVDRQCGGLVRHEKGVAGDYWHSAITQPGNSGSGVYDMSGHLVGIVTHYRRCRNGQICGGRISSLYGKDILHEG